MLQYNHMICIHESIESNKVLGTNSHHPRYVADLLFKKKLMLILKLMDYLSLSFHGHLVWS